MYTSTTEIQSDFKSAAFTTSSLVTIATVDGFIAEADALINAYVGSVYQTPLTTGEGLNLLKMLSRSLVSGRIKKILEVKQDKNADANQSVQGVLLSPTQVMKILADIRDENIVLAGATRLSSSDFYSNNAANDICPVAKKDDKQW